MKLLVKSRVFRRNLQQILASILTAFILLFLFVKAQPVDSDLHYALLDDLRGLQARDAELGEAVMQHHYQLFHNYDFVVATMRRMQELAAVLPQFQENGLLPDTPQAMRELSVLQQQVNQKAVALEEFKSNNAVSKTALIYLPRTVSAVLDRLTRTDFSHHEDFERLLRDALLLEVNQSSRAHELLMQDIEVVDRIIPGLPADVRDSATLASRHARSVLQNENGMPALLEQLSSHGKTHIGTDLEQFYLEHYRDEQRSATRYRLLLLMAAMAVLAYAIFAYYRARERGQQLSIAAAAFDTHESIMIYNPDRLIQRVNHSFTKLTGYTPEEVIGRAPDMLRSGRHEEEFFRKRWETIQRVGYWQGEIWNRHKEGKIYPVWLTTTAVKDEDGQVTHYVSVLTDITQRKEAEEQIYQLAFYDPLTQLPNRRLLMDRLEHALLSSERSGVHGAILFIDLDNFKVLNDTKGHEVGDLLLIEVARRLQSCVRAGDTIARLGGDEFVVMLGDLSVEVELAATQAKAVGENIRETLSRPYLLNNLEYHSSCSIGVSLFHAHDATIDDLLRRADTAMYEAKTLGRNALCFYDPVMQAVLESRVLLENDLRIAVTERQLKLYYQVQVDAERRPLGAEALLRWQHPVRGLVQPDQFISSAEESGQILSIGEWVLDTACAQIKTWESNPQACNLQIAINVSARQFHQPGFVGQVNAALAKTSANPARLKIELTESVVLDDINDTAEKMRELKKTGVRFSMDDFGTGYSSLAYLTQLPLDQLKIDQSFVRNIGAKSSDAVIVQTIIGMANNLGIDVIAEGVETESQLDFLVKSGCMAYQGYLFSSPVPLEEFENNILR